MNETSVIIRLPLKSLRCLLNLYNYSNMRPLVMDIFLLQEWTPGSHCNILLFKWIMQIIQILIT